ncbi:Exosome complex component RRP4 (Exosome component 2) (Ribosomal RNA-processing protein 4) [Durusdinium trenchii]|uniref:Exosome complex component RRP4 (Exosome component 2) (Ribosomal RNA-processing protein 4) n=1 Tax=Durusdinium trenchii TaxID=1381693 RepID=A0ABP0H585_9DINO
MAWATSAITQLAGAVALERRGRGAQGEKEGSLAIDNPKLSVQSIPGLQAQLVCPGDVVSAEPGALRGRGVVERADGKLVATTCGVVEHVNKLLYVRPLKHRYAGSVGDVVVGRIVEVQTDRWAVEIGTAQLAYLHLGAIHLPGNVQRRRTDEDTLRIREFFDENDLISAEVQKVQESGELALQTRNSRYGKLQNGVLACVPSVFVRRQAQHLVNLPRVGVMVVLGNNGWVWVCAPPKVAGSGRQETINFSQMDVRYQKVNPDMRERISRVRNSVLCLVGYGLEITPDSITFLYEQSLKLDLAAWELLDSARCDSAGLVEKLVAEVTQSGDPFKNLSSTWLAGGEKGELPEESSDEELLEQSRNKRKKGKAEVSETEMADFITGLRRNMKKPETQAVACEELSQRLAGRKQEGIDSIVIEEAATTALEAAQEHPDDMQLHMTVCPLLADLLTFSKASGSTDMFTRNFTQKELQKQRQALALQSYLHFYEKLDGDDQFEKVFKRLAKELPVEAVQISERVVWSLCFHSHLTWLRGHKIRAPLSCAQVQTFVRTLD